MLIFLGMAAFNDSSFAVGPKPVLVDAKVNVNGVNAYGPGSDGGFTQVDS